MQRPQQCSMRAWLGEALLLLLLCAAGAHAQDADQPLLLSQERVVFQLESGDFEFAFLPEVAPVTAAHIFTLVQLGLYTTNQIFRVDKGFVAQCSDVTSGRLAPLTEQQKEHASKTVPLEVKKGVKHHEGVLSMGRYDDPNSGTSSFSILLGDAPHLDMQYTIFGKITRGMGVVKELEKLPTRREGIFVMPLNRITIVNSYWYRVGSKPFASLTLPGGAVAAHASHLADATTAAGSKSTGDCEEDLKALQERFLSVSLEVQDLRRKLLP